MSLVRAIPEEEFSQAVLAKARRYARCSDRVRRDEEHADVWWVSGSAEYAYRVGLISQGEDCTPWVTCTCTYGTKVGAGACRCSHVAAVLEAAHLLTDSV